MNQQQELLALFRAMDDEPEVREGYICAPFAYTGSKYNSLDEILPRLPYRAKYVEPFGGSGAVLLARRPSPLEVFNDRFSGVTAFYRCLQNPDLRHLLLERCNLCLHSREEFIRCRDTWEDCTDPVERAARWWYSVTASFSSQGRNFGRSVKGKAQIGPKLKSNLRFFEPCHQRLRNVQIENQDWRVMLRDFDDEDTVWYMDPTYLEYAKGSYKYELSPADHLELCERIFKLRGFVALSGYRNEIYDRFPWNSVHSWKVSSSAAALAKSDTNHLDGVEMRRLPQVETLYIKEEN